MSSIHTVSGGGGLALHVREWGNPDGPPILFIHGLSQNHLCWMNQVDSALADEFRLVAFDLRGHGMSEAPLTLAPYTSSKIWADDVAAVIAALALERPVLVGWSYGGFPICDYVRYHSADNIAGINFVGACVKMSDAANAVNFGPGAFENFAGLLSDDLPTNIRATRGLVHACTAAPLPPDQFEIMLSANILVSPRVREYLNTREIDNDDILAGLKKPVLVSHGRQDIIILPVMSEHTLRTCPVAEASWYDDTGHMPFLEASARFNQELAAFVRRANS
jgi:pimeloyl-ACP methyl ester carboxylesterase